MTRSVRPGLRRASSRSRVCASRAQGVPYWSRAAISEVALVWSGVSAPQERRSRARG